MKTGPIIRIILVGIVSYFVLDYLGTAGDKGAFEQHTWLWAVLGVIIMFHIAAEACVNALERVLYITLRPEARERYDKERAFAKANEYKWVKETYKSLAGTRPIEEEGEIILDHNYDGIKELDNKLPPWWVYGFYVTILFAAIYLIRFEVFNDYTQEEEYETAVAIAKAEVEEYKRTAKNLVDVNTVTFLAEASDLKAGQAIFEGNCVACHKASGGGGIGPNLTDDHWILGGGIKNIFNTISEGGRDGMGMVAWKSELKPAEMAQVASYVVTLHGTNPEDAKEAEGEIWIDPDAPVEENEGEVKEEGEAVVEEVIDNE